MDVPATARNRSPKSPPAAARPLADVLSDPDTEWSEVRAAIKTQGRGSLLMMGNGKTGNVAATTNLGVLKALRASVGHEAHQKKHQGAKPVPKRSSTFTTVASSDDEDDDGVLDWGDESPCPAEPLKGVKFTDASAEKSSKETLADIDPVVRPKKLEDNHANKSARSPKSNSKRDASVRVSLKGVKEDSAEAGLDDDSLEHEINDTGRNVVPPRRLPKSSSAGGSFRNGLINVAKDKRTLPARRLTGSFKGNLKNVIENLEASIEDSSDEDNDFHSTQKKERRLPARRLMRGTSAKGGSFRASLKNVLEDTEADMDDDSLRLDDGGDEVVEAAGGRRRSHPVARRLPDRGQSFSRRASLESIHLYDSNSSLSSASCTSGIHKESINIMDFGVNPNGRRPFTESMLSLNGSSSNASPSTASNEMSALVDSEGFLGWKNDSSSSSRSINYHPVSNKSSRGHHCLQFAKGPGCLHHDMNDSNLSNMVDSQGFLDWKSRGDDSSRDLASVSVEDINAEEKSSVVQEGDDVEPSSEDLFESWHIEDYEDPNDMVEVTQEFPKAERNGSGSLITEMKRLSSKVSEGIESAKRHSWNINADTVRKEIKTNDVKHILLRGHRSDDVLANGAKRSEGSRRNSAFQSFFSAGRRGSGESFSSSGPEDEYYSGPCIRINREDNVDIGELRKELVDAARDNSGGQNISKLKMAFF